MTHLRIQRLADKRLLTPTAVNPCQSLIAYQFPLVCLNPLLIIIWLPTALSVLEITWCRLLIHIFCLFPFQIL